MKKVLAMLLALCMMLGVAGMATAEEEIVTLRWVTVGNGMPANYDSWIAQVNEYVGEKIGVNIEMQVIDWGGWDNRRNVIINTNEPYDIIFGNDGTYNNDVQLGAYYEITDEDLATYAPGLLELIPADYWDAVRVNGKIYAVPSYKDSSMTNYFVWDKDLLDANGLDTTEMHDLAAVEETLYTLKDLVDMAPFTTNGNGNGFILANYDSMSSGLPALGVRVDDESRQVVAVFEQDDIMETLTLFHKWFNDGIINADAAVLAETPSYRPFYVAQGWPYAAVSTWGPSMGVNAIAVQLGDTILSNGTVQGSLNSISINCARPDKALEFLNLINTDSYVRDLFAYGEEGVDWEYNEQGLITRHNPAWDIPAYTQGTFFNLTQETEYNQYEEEVRPLNDSAVPSVMLGFFFDTSSVQDQLSSCIEIYNRYKNEILTGTTDPATSVPQMMDEMRAAGFDEIVAEAQTQIDAWVELTAEEPAAEEPATETEEPAAETEEPAAETESETEEPAAE